MAAAIAAPPAPLSRDQQMWRWKILVATYVAYMGYYLTRKVFGICKTTIASDLQWELHYTGWVWASFLVAYMLGQFLNSFIGRKWGARVILLGGLGASLCINAAFGFMNSPITFMVFMAFNGLVQASGWPGVVGGIAHWLRPAERGHIMGFWSTNYLVGNLVVKGLAGWLLGAYGWRWSFWGLTLITVLVWLIVWWWQRDKPEDAGLEPIVTHEEGENTTIRTLQTDEVSFGEYLRLAFNPFILMMGLGYFCVKFIRYSLDSWLPAFLNLQGLEPAMASYYTLLFDLAGLPGVILAGYALDRLYGRNWAALCFTMALGTIAGYLAVVYLGATPLSAAICFAFVGFMLYGPDTLLSGAAAVEVAGERNGVAVAGLVNGIASLGPVLQELVIAELLKADKAHIIRNSNRLGLAVAVVFALMMALAWWRLNRVRRANRQTA